MSDLFLKILNMSIAAGYLVVAVVVLRLVLRKAPRWTFVLLWGIVAIRLLVPFSIESKLSMIPSAQTIPETVLSGPNLDIQPELPPADIPAIENPVNPDTYIWVVPTDQGVNTMEILSLLWLGGMALMAAYALISYGRLRRRVATAIRQQFNIYCSENVVSPFVLGLFRPRIYLPNKMPPQDMAHVIAHEQAHIRRKDHWWKPFGFLLLTLHWFNPLMWLAYALLCRDIELACDEKVIKTLENEQRAAYSETLLQCSVNRASIAACPLAFGEVCVKERVKNVLNYKKPAFWIILVAVIACAAVAVCFLTDPISKSKTNDSPDPNAPGDAKLWYDSSDAGDRSGEFTLEAFPGVTFRWNESKIEAITGDSEAAIIKALVIRNIYSSDLNNDGYPEICATVDNASGVYDCHIIVYDYATGASYSYGKERSIYAYYLRVQDGHLLCNKVAYSNLGHIEATGRLVFIQTDTETVLTMETDTPVSQVTSAITLFERYDKASPLEGNVQLDAFDGISLRWSFTPNLLSSEELLLLVREGEEMPLFSDIGGVITAAYIADVNGDGYPEICANVYCHRSGLPSYNTVAVYDCVTDTYCYLGASSLNYYTIECHYLKVENGKLICERVKESTKEVTACGYLAMVDTAEGRQLYLALMQK